MNEDEANDLVALTTRYLSGDESEEAEDGYFELAGLCARSPELAWPLIATVAERVEAPGERASLGAGLLESFIRAHSETHAELIADGIIGSA